MSGMTDHIELYRSGLRRKKWRWRYVAANGNILADSGQGYSRKIDALAGALAVTGRDVLDGDTLRSIDAEDALPVVEVEK